MKSENNGRSLWYWNVVWFSIGISLALFLSLFLIYGFTEQGTRQLMRWSSRISFSLFCIAFAASSVHAIFKSSWSWWMRMNRKYLGISFAIIHLIHLGFVVLLQYAFHPVFDLAAMSSIVGGGIAYFFVITMLISSFDRVKIIMNPIYWKVHHTLGGYWIWTIFLTTYWKRADTEPIHWIPVFVLLIIVLLRLYILLKKKIFDSASVVCLILSILTISCHSQNPIEGDVLFTNGKIIDGTGSKTYLSDLLVDGDRIKWIGHYSNANIVADTVIDVSGKVIVPGFIDLHAHGDPKQNPEFFNFLSMGVTTVALGMDGSSITSAEIKEWIDDISGKGTGVNILPFIGHGTVRNESGIGTKKAPTSDNLNHMVQLVRSAMESGCWGLSMGLEYHPGYYADSTELLSLAKVVGEYDALITSHIRNEDNDLIESSLDEMFALADHCNVNISHLKVVFGKGRDRAHEIINKLEDVNREYEISADLYPYTASYTGIGIVFPQWAKVPKKYQTIKEERGSELLTYLRERVNHRNGPAATLFGSGPYKGKTLSDLEEEYNLPFEQILKDIIGPYGASAAFFVMDKSLQETLMKSEKVMIASDGSPTMHHPRGYGTFSKVLEEYVVRDSILTIEEAVYKMSGMPARIVGLTDRGILKKGNIADIVIFEPEKIKASATFDNPHLTAKGIDMVLIAGQVALEKGIYSENKGVVLRRTSYK